MTLLWKTHQTWLHMKISPKLPFWYWLSALLALLLLHKVGFLYLCNEMFWCVCVCETKKDHYCQWITFHPLCCFCRWRINTPQPEPTDYWDNQPCLFMLLIYAMQQSNSPIPITVQGLAMAVASRTKLHISGLQHCAFGKEAIGGRGGGRQRGETAAVGEYRSSSILMCANSLTPAD